MGLVYMNGSFVPKEEAKVSVFDHGFLYGDGVFEGIRAYDGVIFRLNRHIRRLYNSAKAIRLEIPMSEEEMIKATVETVKVNNLRDAYIRLVVSRGEGDLGLDPRKCLRPNVIIIADEIVLFPEELYEKGLEIVTAAPRKNYGEVLSPQIKSLNYLSSVMAKIEAIEAGRIEALMITREGYVAEGTGDNVFIVKNGVLMTPPPYVGILEGITREAVMEIAQDMGIKVLETPFTRFDVYAADECFLTGTAAEMIPVIAVDGRKINDGEVGPTFRKLLRKFREIVKNDGVKVYE
ncbi:MAG: branched-chain-amino-acid transaminase [Synergistetes bacterium]|nr:branched-chain-amino-acid transaminase [Synergistota bacterium]